MLYNKSTTNRSKWSLGLNVTLDSCCLWRYRRLSKKVPRPFSTSTELHVPNVTQVISRARLSAGHHRLRCHSHSYSTNKIHGSVEHKLYDKIHNKSKVYCKSTTICTTEVHIKSKADNNNQQMHNVSKWQNILQLVVRLVCCPRRIEVVEFGLNIVRTPVLTTKFNSIDYTTGKEAMVLPLNIRLPIDTTYYYTMQKSCISVTWYSQLIKHDEMNKKLWCSHIEASHLCLRPAHNSSSFSSTLRI